MLRKSSEMKVEIREKMRGGEGNIQIKHLFQEEDLKGKVRLTAEITIPVGGSIGFHQHDQEEEIFYFIAGRGEVKENEEIRVVDPGDAVVTGGGNSHSVKNISTEPLIMMAVILLY